MNITIDHDVFNKLLMKTTRLSLAMGTIVGALSATLNQMKTTMNMNDESILLIYDQLRDAHHQSAKQCHEIYYRDEL